MSRTLRVDLLRRLLRQRQTLESLRTQSGPGFDAALAAARHNGEIIDGGSAASGSPQTATLYLTLSPETRAEFDRLISEGQDHFADAAKDDVGRRFILALAEGLPPAAAGAARRLLEEAACYQYVRGEFRVERTKAAALTGALIETNVVALLRRAGEEVAADALAAMPIGQPPHEAAVVAGVIRESYAPLLTGAPSRFARACADAADAVAELFEGHRTDSVAALAVAEALGGAFADLVAARGAAAADSFEAVTAVEEVA